MNRDQRRHPEHAPAASHVHASPAAGQPGGTIEISILSAQILLDLCNVSGSLLGTSQAKLQVGMAQQELERALPIQPPEPAGDVVAEASPDESKPEPEPDPDAGE